MYFRWFVRRDNRGVDFGEWTSIPMSALYLPLDVHTGNMGRALGLLRRAPKRLEGNGRDHGLAA